MRNAQSETTNTVTQRSITRKTAVHNSLKLLVLTLHKSNVAGVSDAVKQPMTSKSPAMNWNNSGDCGGDVNDRVCMKKIISAIVRSQCSTGKDDIVMTSG